MATTARIILNTTARKRNDGSFPVALCITHNRKRDYITLFSCTPEQWDATRTRFNAKFPNHKVHNELLLTKEHRAKEIIWGFEKRGEVFSFANFNRELVGMKEHLTVVDALKRHTDSLLTKDKVGNAEKFDTVRRLFGQFKPTLKLGEVTPKTLTDFEAWLRKRPCTDVTIAVYLRTFRAMVNVMIADGFFPAEKYPFAKGGYSLAHLNKSTRKRALTKQDMGKIELCPSLEGRETLAKHLFLFSYYQRGMNLIDMANLKWSDVVGDKIHYIRQKTHATFVGQVHPKSVPILSAYRHENPISKVYCFPLFDDKKDISKLQKRKRIGVLTASINFHLKNLALKAGIDNHQDITTYVARHSYATVLKRAGVSTEIISEALGHAELTTTEIYLDSFGEGVIDKIDTDYL